MIISTEYKYDTAGANGDAIKQEFFELIFACVK